MKNSIIIYSVLVTFWFFLSCEKSKISIMQDKEKKGYTILESNEEGFYYANSKRICYFHYKEKLDSTIYEDGKTLIRLYEPKLIISDKGEIYAEKDFSEKAYEGYLDYFDGPLMTLEVKKALTQGILSTDIEEKPFFFPKEGFVTSYNCRKFLICPKTDNVIEALLVDDEAGYEISQVEYETGQFLFNLIFELSDLPRHLQPKFSINSLNSAMYDRMIEGEENQLCFFYYPLKVNTDGSLIQSNNIVSEKINLVIDKDSFREKKALMSAIEECKGAIIDQYNNCVFNAVRQNAHDLQYYYEVFCNKNELRDMYGKTCYINATIDRVSEKDEDGEYYISFKFSTFETLFFFINGYSRDERISKLHLPAHVLLKAKLKEIPDAGHLTFIDIELLGYINS